MQRGRPRKSTLLDQLLGYRWAISMAMRSVVYSDLLDMYPGLLPKAFGSQGGIHGHVYRPGGRKAIFMGSFVQGMMAPPHAGPCSLHGGSGLRCSLPTLSHAFV